MHEVRAKMEKLVDDGLTQNIGISNFNCQLIMNLLTYANYKPATLQIELHPYLQQSRLVEWAKQQGIQVTAYSSFGPSFYTLEHAVFEAITSKHNKTPAQILLRWSVEKKVAVIPKSINESRIVSNLNVFSFSLDYQVMEDIKKLDENLRFNSLFTYDIHIPLLD